MVNAYVTFDGDRKEAGTSDGSTHQFWVVCGDGDAGLLRAWKRAADGMFSALRGLRLGSLYGFSARRMALWVAEAVWAFVALHRWWNGAGRGSRFHDSDGIP